MPNNLLVPSGQTIRFDDQVPKDLQRFVSKVPLETLNDLVASGLVSSEEKISSMLNAAQEVTDSSLRAITNTRQVRLTSTGQMDLGRFRPFMVRAPQATVPEREWFWEIFRNLPSEAVANLSPTAELHKILPFWKPVITTVKAANVKIDTGATLDFGGAILGMNCDHILIKKNGRIEIATKNFVLKAKSIEGEQ